MKKIFLPLIIGVVLLSACSLFGATNTDTDTNTSANAEQKNIVSNQPAVPDFAACLAKCETVPSIQKHQCQILCSYDSTKATGDPKYCSEIFNFEPEDTAEQSLLGIKMTGPLAEYASCLYYSKSTDVSYCNPLSGVDKTVCVSDTAKRAKDVSICFNNLDSAINQSICIEGVAKVSQDASICQRMNDIKNYAQAKYSIPACEKNVKNYLKNQGYIK